MMPVYHGVPRAVVLRAIAPASGRLGGKGASRENIVRCFSVEGFLRFAHRGRGLGLTGGAFSLFLLISAIAQNEIPGVIVVGHPTAEISPDLATQKSLLSRYAGAATIV